MVPAPPEGALLEVAVGLEALARQLSSSRDHDEPALADLALAQLEVQEALDDLESLLRRCEEALLAAGSEPKRPTDTAGEEDRARAALVQPSRRHRATQLLERLCMAAGRLREREDRLGVDGHLRLRALEAV